MKKGNLTTAILSTFEDKSNLNKHVAIIHGGKKSFKCNVCDASFTSNPRLKKHIEKRIAIFVIQLLQTKAT